MTNEAKKFNNALKAEVAKGVTEITEQFVVELVERLGGGYAFDTYYPEFNLRSVDEVIIPEGIKTIGFGAFNYWRIKTITIPGSVTSIGEGAFGGLTNIEKVILGNGVTSIGDKAFFNCIHLKQINIPNTVKSIGSDAFFNCIRLEEITIPGRTIIGDNAFGWCDSLRKITYVA